MPRRQTNFNRDKALLGKSLDSLNKLLVKFDYISDFRVNILACIFYGIDILNNKATNTRLGPRIKRVEFCEREAIQYLQTNSSLNDLDFSNFIGCVQRKFSNIRLVLFSNDSEKVQFAGDIKRALSKDINVYLRESGDKMGIFNILTFPAAFYKVRHLCPFCLVFSNSKKRHMCQYKCVQCEESCGSIPTDQPKYCKDCNRLFLNSQCFTNHKKNICDAIHRCLTCSCDFKTGFDHDCESEICGRCNSAHPLGLCYILNGTENPESRIYFPKHRHSMYYDIETITTENGVQEPILLVCAYIDKITGQYQFKSFNKYGSVMNDFIDFLLQVDPKCKMQMKRKGVMVTKKKIRYMFQSYILIAHNFKGFDGVFVMNQLQKHYFYRLSMIYSGSKLQMLRVAGPGITFLDSLNFVHCSLRNLSKMFGLTESKTFFPYSLLTKDDMNYRGCLPSIEKYEINNLRVSERDEFFEFYNKQKIKFQNREFVLKHELYLYCRQDVKVLAICMEKFRFLIKQETKFDPFARDITLASVCLRDFITNHLNKHTLGIIPARGYFKCSNQSAAALDYLNYTAQKRNIKIRHAKNHKDSEFKLGPYSIDGICFEKKILFEFHGCYYHGCPECFSDRDYNFSQKQSFQHLHTKTILRECEIRSLMHSKLGSDFRLEIMWEHGWNEITKTQAYKNYHKQKFPLTDPTISERGFFYGGRTNAVQFYAKAIEGEISIEYRDVCSLYPFVNKYFSYPIGHPDIIQDNFDYTPEAYFGIIKCTVIPPETLFHPVLPHRAEGKLMFPLCRVCCDTQQTDTACTHTDTERALTGEWCTPELYYALTKGYILSEIFCVFNFPNRMGYIDEHNPGLFGAYIDSWLKIKIEASGWPSSVKTEAQKADYIRMYKDRENITLDPEKICFNPGLRSLAKLLLNSLWGRVGMSVDKLSTTIKSVEQFHMLFSDNSIEIGTYHPIAGDKVMFNFRNINSGHKTNKKGNVIVAAFVTSWARIYLHKQLDRLGDRVCYMDTDSVIYTKREGEYEPPVGDMLGEWANEVPPGVHITEFVTTGPKSYSYKLSNNEVKIKSKGISQSYHTKDLLSFTAMKQSVDKMLKLESYKLVQGIVIENKLHFDRSKFTSTIRKRPQTKTLHYGYNKRVKYSDPNNMYISYPYGYKL